MDRPDATSPPAADEDDGADPARAPLPGTEVGILFIHGMGKHQRGDFLQQVGNPLYRWTAGWIGRGNAEAARRSMRPRGSSLRIPHRDDDGGPAHSLIDTLVPGADGRRQRITWLAADGFWSDEVVEPSFGQVASWGLGLAPWMIVRYFRRHWGGVLVVPSLVLVVLFQMLILTLSLFGAVPKLRSSVAGLQLRIAGSIGDVMVMVANPLQFDAIAARIAGDLQWLSEQVPGGRIAVVAHSQGTGVAHAVLQTSHVPVDLFVTFGTALEKLHVARQIQANQRRIALGSTLTIVGGIFLVLAADIAIHLQPEAITVPAVASVACRWLIGAGIVLLMARMGLWFHLRRAGGAMLTGAGIAILLAGLILAAPTWADYDTPWRTALDGVTASGFWQAWTGAGWRLATLGFMLAGLVLVVLREAAAFAKRARYVAGGPAPNPVATERPRQDRTPLGILLDPGSAIGNYAGGTALVVSLLCFAMATPQDQSAEGNTILLLVVAGLAFCFAAVPVPVANLTEATAQDLRLPRREGRMRWHNYWAAADPVPDGNLPAGDPPYVTNHQIHNRDAMLSDHTTYTENREEFLAELLGHLADLADWPAVLPDDAAAIVRAQRRRRWRVGFLTAARWLATVGTVAACWILGSAGLTVFGKPVGAVIGYFVGILPGVSSDEVTDRLPQAFLGVVTVTAIAFFWYRGVVSAAWRYWDLVEAEVLARRERLHPGLTAERRTAVACFALASAIGLCSAIWSPNLLQMVMDIRTVSPPPESTGIGTWAMVRQWPWQRDSLLHTGLWSLTPPGIAVTILVVTVIYTAVILATIHANSRPDR